MAKKSDKSQQKKTNNQSITKPAPVNSSYVTDLINYFNRVISIQSYLIDTNFNLSTFLSFAISQIQTLTKSTGIAIELIEDDKTFYRAALGSLKKYLNAHFNINDSMAALSINTHQIIRYDNTEKDDRINKNTYQSIGSPSSVITAPFFHDGKVIGCIVIVSKKPNAFTELDVQVASIMAGLVGYGISQQVFQEKTKKLTAEQEQTQESLKKAEKKLKHTMHHDYLTGLANRNLFNEQLKIVIAKAKRKKQLVALMYLDIDHFKNINEMYGHSIGDKLLFSFAMRLKQCVRSSDIIARLGGDEFVLLIDDIKEPQDVIVIADKVLQSMRKPFTFNKKSLNITTSIGISFLNDPDISTDEFINQADQALYISKNSGRNTFYIFNSELLHETM